MKNNNAKILLAITVLISLFPIVFQSGLAFAEKEKVIVNIFYFNYKDSIDFIKIYDTGKTEVYIPNSNDDEGSYKTVKLPEKKIKKIIKNIKKSGIVNTEEKSRDFVRADLPFYAIKVVIDGSGYMLGSEHPRFTKKNVVVTQRGLHILKENESKEQYFQDNATDEYKKFRDVWDKCFTELDDIYLEITGSRILDVMLNYEQPRSGPEWQRFLDWLDSESKRLEKQRKMREGQPESAGQNRGSENKQ